MCACVCYSVCVRLYVCACAYLCVCVLSSWLVVLSDRDMHGYVFNKPIKQSYMHTGHELQDTVMCL